MIIDIFGLVTSYFLHIDISFHNIARGSIQNTITDRPYFSIQTNSLTSAQK